MTRFVFLPKIRKEALNTNLPHYFTGRFCKRGHLGVRRANNGQCPECAKLLASFWRRENINYVHERDREYQKNNQETIGIYKKEWDLNHQDYLKSYRVNHYQENKDRYKVWNSSRRARKHNATPKWVDWDEIEYIYKLASEKGLVVDHIVPLTSKYVCGLHAGDNLRCIPKELNSHKSNRYWPDMPEEFVETGD